jgi:neural Wiskott-Aldrich syndrome protein
VNLAAADFSQIPMSQSLAATLARASDAAGALGSSEVALEHVLLALCDDADAEAVLVASRVDVARLRTETLGFLGSIQQPPINGHLGVSSGLTRILEAAAAAARGGRRRDINGAIVLAAIVGDGKSAAAQILQAQGLTFDEAIRALQSALAAPPRDAVPDLRPADDVLAGARARVQSRSAPTLRDIMGQPPRQQIAPPAPPVALPPPAAAPMPVPQPVAQPAAIPAPTPKPEPEPLPEFAAIEEPAAPATEVTAAEPLPSLPPVETVPVSTPVTMPPRPDAGYVYPSLASAPLPPPAPFTMPAPQQAQGPVDFDFSRPVPIATPPPIPPPIPQQAPNFGPQPSQYPYEPGTFNQQQMPAPRWDQQPSQPGVPENRGAYGDPNSQLGRMPSGPPPQMRAPAPMTAGGAAPQQSRGAKPKAETGQLAENIPRAMRVGKTERVEVRIAKSSAKAITDGLEGGGVAWQHAVTVTQAMSVRLRAPDGGFFIETVSPETQWLENHLGFASDEFASWRFLVTPQTRGRAQLQIVVSARTVGGDGMAAETGLPDQVIDVKVRTNYKRTFGRLLGWTLAAVAGGAMAKFGESGLDIAQGLVQKFMQ